MESAARTLVEAGYVMPSPGPATGDVDAWGRAVCARAVALEGRDEMPALEPVGDFLVPVDASAARDFQAFHFDFGLPLVPHGSRDLARYTVLHVPYGAAPTRAATRLVDLRALLAARRWPSRAELLDRFAAYGASHGAWDFSEGYAEGILGRVVEAAAGGPAVLPSVPATPGFLCGTEFASPEEEERFLADRGLDVAGVEVEVRLEPGDALVFDNLRLAHARRGRRRTRELRQLVLGYRALGVTGQERYRDRVLGAFAV